MVSVILPTYNGEEFLAETLDSVVNQTYRPIEIIVVDDGSDDASTRIARSYSEVQLIHQDHAGVPCARNRGAAIAAGDYLAFIDQDDIWESDKLQIQTDYMTTHSDVGYTTTRQLFFLTPGITAPSWLRPGLLTSPKEGPTPSALVVRRSAWDTIGPFDESLLDASDVDWFFRAKDLQILSTSLPDVLIQKRVHSDNHSSRPGQVQSELLKLVRRSVANQRQSGKGVGGDG